MWSDAGCICLVYLQWCVSPQTESTRKFIAMVAFVCFFSTVDFPQITTCFSKSDFACLFFRSETIDVKILTHHYSLFFKHLIGSAVMPPLTRNYYWILEVWARPPPIGGRGNCFSVIYFTGGGGSSEKHILGVRISMIYLAINIVILKSISFVKKIKWNLSGR